MVTALVIYFILSKKYRTPTITTEVLVNRYNSKLNKLERFLKKNGIDFSVEDFKSKIEKQELSIENLKENIKSIAKIEKNTEIIEDIYISNSVAEAKEKLSRMEKGCCLCEFQAELEWDKEVYDVFQMMGFNTTKLDFEQQRYFGSQTFCKIEDKLIFVHNSLALVINPKNIFEANFSEFNLITEKIAKKGEKTDPKYSIIVKAKGIDYSTELIVPQKQGRKLLDKFKKGSEWSELFLVYPPNLVLSDQSDDVNKPQEEHSNEDYDRCKDDSGSVFLFDAAEKSVNYPQNV